MRMQSALMDRLQCFFFDRDSETVWTSFMSIFKGMLEIIHCSLPFVDKILLLLFVQGVDGATT